MNVSGLLPNSSIWCSCIKVFRSFLLDARHPRVQQVLQYTTLHQSSQHLRECTEQLTTLGLTWKAFIFLTRPEEQMRNIICSHQSPVSHENKYKPMKSRYINFLHCALYSLLHTAHGRKHIFL